MPPGAREQTRILLAADAFAYLPLFAAARMKPRLKLAGDEWMSWDEHFLAPTHEIPPAYLDGARDAHAKGDTGCLRAIVKAWELGTPTIGLCDPCEIPRLGYRDELVVVAGLITRPCFWCVGDSAIYNARSLDGFQASHLVIHKKEFATGYHIGDYIAKELAKHGALPEVYYSHFDYVVDGARALSQAQGFTRVAAISASVLSAAIAHVDGSLRVAFPVQKIPRFEEFLTTGFVVPRAALENDDQFRQRVIFLLFSILLALRHLSNAPQAAKDLIVSLGNEKNRFHEERIISAASVAGNEVDKPSGKLPAPEQINGTHAHWVHRWLIDDDIYSKDLDISSAQWKAAYFGLRTQQISSEKDWPPLADVFDRTLLQRAQIAFDEQVMTHAWQREAGVLLRHLRFGDWITRLVLAGVLIATWALSVSQWPPPAAIRGVIASVVLVAAGLLAAPPDWRDRMIQELTRRIAGLKNKRMWLGISLGVSGVLIVAMVLLLFLSQYGDFIQNSAVDLEGKKIKDFPTEGLGAFALKFADLINVAWNIAGIFLLPFCGAFLVCWGQLFPKKNDATKGGS